MTRPHQSPEACAVRMQVKSGERQPAGIFKVVLGGASSGDSLVNQVSIRRLHLYKDFD